MRKYVVAVQSHALRISDGWYYGLSPNEKLYNVASYISHVSCELQKQPYVYRVLFCFHDLPTHQTIDNIIGHSNSSTGAA